VPGSRSVDTWKWPQEPFRLSLPRICVRFDTTTVLRCFLTQQVSGPRISLTAYSQSPPAASSRKRPPVDTVGPSAPDAVLPSLAH
jgi:hypothetical protein